MLKFFYRLKRRGGVVLFMVIAIMTLLIAMATTAYFTARSSYKTVISNYNFSQMYIAATSVTDMVISAATQSAQYSDSSKKAVAGNNYYDELNKALQALKTKEPGTAAAKFVMLSDNIKGLYNSSGSISDAAVFNAVANGESTEPGILDAVKVVVSLDRISWESDTPAYSGKHDKPADDCLSRYYYTFTTTAYYRHNSITVQDTIYNVAGKTSKKTSETPDFSTFFTSTGQYLKEDGSKDKNGQRVVVVDCDSISDKTYFQSRMTIFSAMSRSNKFMGGVTASGALYLCGQTSTGGCTDSGKTDNLPAPGTDAKGNYNRHDWFIGGDFAVLNTNTHLKFNGNNLYVKGDLIVAADSGISGADNIFVEGNVYILTTTSTIGCNNLYVKGDIVAGGNPSTLNLSNAWNKRDTKIKTVADMIKEIKNKIDEVRTTASDLSSDKTKNVVYDTNAFQNTATGSTEFDSHKLKPGDGCKNIYMNGTPKNFKSGSAPSYTSGVPTNINVDIAVQVEAGDTYKTQKVTVSLDTIFDTSGANSPIKETKFANLTSTAATIENTLNIDFTNYDPSKWEFEKNSDGVVTGLKPLSFETADGDTVTATWTGTNAYDMWSNDANTAVFKFTAKNGKVATVTVKGNKKQWTLDIPWCKDGYALYLQGNGGDGTGFPFDGEGATINIGTVASTVKKVTVPTDDGKTKEKLVADPDNAMTIVLKGNFNDSGAGAVVDNHGFNAFSWTGKKKLGSNPYVTKVLLVDDTDFTSSAVGEVVFEMGNISSGYTDPETSKNYPDKSYMPYRKPYKDGSTPKTPVKAVVTYYMSQKEFIGTLDQYDGAATEPWEKMDTIKTYFDKGSDPKAKYDNRVMLVSNKNNGLAIDGLRMGNLLCGYIYAPNSALYNYGDGKLPVFGGMIVSDYAAIDAYYLYAEPNPEYIISLASALENPDEKSPDDPEETPADGFWSIYGVELGRNYIG